MSWAHVDGGDAFCVRYVGLTSNLELNYLDVHACTVVVWSRPKRIKTDQAQKASTTVDNGEDLVVLQA